MRRWFLRTLATMTFRYGWLVLPLLIGVTVLACWPLGRMNFDTSLASFLPPLSPEARNVRELLDYRNLEPIVVVVRAKQPGHAKDLIKIADALAPVLNHPRYVSAVVYKVDELAQSYYQSLSNLRLIALLTPDDWTALKQQMTQQISTRRLLELRAQRISALLPRPLAINVASDPLGALDAVRRRLATSRGPTLLEVTDGYFMTPDGRTLTMLVYPIYPPENGRATLRTIGYLGESRDFLLTRNPEWAKLVDIEFLGSHATTALYLKRMALDLEMILKFSVPLAFLLILLVFRKLEAVVFILLPPALGTLWTLGLATVTFGGITWVTAAALLAIAGIGLHYAVHLFHRFMLELYRTGNYYRALTQAYVETGRGVLVSAVVVALLFFFLFAAALGQVHEGQSAPALLRAASGFGQLGLVAGAGILCNLAACFLTLPALAFVKHLLARGRIKPVALYRFPIEKLTDLAIASPRGTLAMLLLASVIFGYQARGLRINPRFASITPFLAENTASQEAAGGATSSGGVEAPGRPVVAVVSGATLEEALLHNDKLYDNLQHEAAALGILSFDSLRTVLPSQRSQESSIHELQTLDLAPLRDAIDKASREAGFKPIIYEPFLDALRALQTTAGQVKYITFSSAESDAFIATVQRYVTHKENGLYYIATPIYPHADGFDAGELARLRSALAPGVSTLTLLGDPLVEQHLSQSVKYNLALMLLIGVTVLFVALALHFRRIRRVWLAFAAVGFEVLWLCGGLGLAGIHFHFFTLLIMPMLLSLAMDNALQLTQYYYDRNCTALAAIEAVGRATVLNCGLTALIYGTLALAFFPGLRDLGDAVLIGALAVLAGTLMLLPALLHLFGRGQPLISILMIEPETEG